MSEFRKSSTWTLETSPKVHPLAVVDPQAQLDQGVVISPGCFVGPEVKIGSNTWVNPPLRFDDEPVRHKLLDLIGDLALVGFPKAQVLVYRGSHGLHTDLAVALLQ